MHPPDTDLTPPPSWQLQDNTPGFPCVSREGALDSAVKALAKRHGNESSDKQDNPLAMTFCHPGGGKSFFMDLFGHKDPLVMEAAQRATPKFLPVMQDYVPISILFNSGFQALPHGFTGSVEDVAHAVSTRILFRCVQHLRFASLTVICHSHFLDHRVDVGNSAYKRFPDFSAFATHMDNARIHHVGTALDAVFADMAQNQREHSAILLLVDEMSKLEHNEKSCAVKVAKLMGSMLDKYKNAAKFMCIVSSLKTGVVQELETDSGRSIDWIELPSSSMVRSR